MSGLPEGYSIRPLTLDDAVALAAAYDRNREHLVRWDPDRTPEFYTEAGQRAGIRDRLAEQARGLFSAWVLVAPDGDVVGRASIQHITRGTLQSGTLGYWVDAGHVRRGLAAAAVDFLVAQGTELGLHRLEAGTMVENVASQRVLERCGFERYGLAPRLVFIHGAWQDHVLFQRILNDRPLGPQS